MNKIINYSKGLLRASPIIIIVTSALMYALFQVKFALYFTIFILIVNLLSHFLKVVSKFIYNNIFNKTYLPILGLGRRPDGAKYTGCFIEDTNLEGISTSFGMPSGHSIIAISTAVMLSWYIYKTQKPSVIRSASITLLHFICIMIAFSRYPLGCHTIQQIIVGCLFGILFGRIGIHLFEKFEFI